MARVAQTCVHPRSSIPTSPTKCYNHRAFHLFFVTLFFALDEMFTQPLPVARARVLSPAEIERPNADPSGLEASLLQLIQDHHQTSLKLRDETEKAKKDAIRTAMRVSDLLVDTVNSGVQEAFINEKRIELESRALTATVIRFAKQTHQWLAASHAINTAIKEIGDFENWMKTMDFDCRSINAAIRNIHQP